MDEQEQYLFDLHGYLVVEDALSSAQLATLNRRIDETLAGEPDPNMRTKRFGPGAWGQDYFQTINNPRIAPYLTQMIGKNFRLDHAYADVIRTGLGPSGAALHGGATPYDPSQYYVFRNGRMYNGLMVVAYNLKDVAPGEGGFGCIPGSHKSNYPTPREWLDLEKPAPCVRAVPGKAGSAILFTEALTHGTMPWRGAGERRTLFLKYCPRHMAWSRNYITPENVGAPAESESGVTEEQGRVLRTPGMYPH